MRRIDRIRGSLFGLAYGDALAARAEFLSVDEILARWPGGPRELEGDPALITDDTQMALAVGDALVAVFGEPADAGRASVSEVQAALAAAFSAWFESSDNTRSPGLTCLAAAARLSQGFGWRECTIIHSKGCGANMRVTPVGLLGAGWRRTTSDGAVADLATLAQMQAAMTHGHPTALAASELTALAVAWLVEGRGTSGLVEMLRARCDSERLTYHEGWLGSLWEAQHGVDSGAQFIARGWSECGLALDRLEAALAAGDRDTDPCEQTGGAWVADQLLSTSLLCFLLFPDDPVAALNRAAVSRGDSDSIAAVAGAYLGAHLGFDAWPSGWHAVIEAREQLEALAAALDRIGA